MGATDDVGQDIVLPKQGDTKRQVNDLPYETWLQPPARTLRGTRLDKYVLYVYYYVTNEIMTYIFIGAQSDACKNRAF